MKKILFVLPIYLPAQLTGAEMVIKDLAEVLAKQSYEVTVVTSNALTARYWYDPIFGKKVKTRLETINGVRVIRLSCNHIASSLFFVLWNILEKFSAIKYAIRPAINAIELFAWGPILIHLQKTIEKIRPDFIVVSPFPAGICLSVNILCSTLHIPYAVIPFFKKDQELFKNTLLPKILDDAAVIYSPTMTEKKYLTQYTNNTHITILPSSIDIEYIEGHMLLIQKKASELKKNPLFIGKKIILFVGFKGVGKGIIDVAEVVRHLKRKDVLLVAIGNDTTQWKSYMKDHPLRVLVNLAYMEGVEKYAYYAISDMLVLPSVTDNFPLVFLEAWQFKKPVVAYDFYSMKELLRDGSGFLVKNRNQNELSQTIIYLLDHPTCVKKSGDIGYRKMKRYSRDTIMTNYFLPPIKQYISHE